MPKGPPPIPRHALGDDAPPIDGNPDVGDATELTTGGQTELTDAGDDHSARTSAPWGPRPSAGDLTVADRRAAPGDATLDEPAPDLTLDEATPDSPFDDDDSDSDDSDDAP